MKKYGKRSVFVLLLAVLLLLAACGGPSQPAASQPNKSKAPASSTAGDPTSGTTKYPAGPIIWWATGQPEFRKIYYDNWFNSHQDIAEGCYVEPTTIKTTNEGQQQVAMYKMSGDFKSMPDIMFLDLRQYIMDVPDEILEAARIDGCSDFRIFWTIVCPMIKPALASWASITLVARWNDFFWPLLFLTKRSKQTLMVSVAQLPLADGLATPWQVILAGTTLVIIPSIIIYVVIQSFQKDGAFEGAIKG